MTNQKTNRSSLLSVAQCAEERDQTHGHASNGEHPGNDREDRIHGDMVAKSASAPTSINPADEHHDAEERGAEPEHHAATVTGDRENLLAEAKGAFDAAGHMPQGTMDHESQWLLFARLYNVAERMIDALAVTVGAPAVPSWGALHDELYSLIPFNVQGERAFELSSEMVQVIKAHCTRVAAARRTIPRHPRSELESRAVDMIGHLDQHGFTGADFGEVSDLIDQMLPALAAPVEVDAEKLADAIADELGTDSWIARSLSNGRINATARRLVEFAVKPVLRGEGR